MGHSYLSSVLDLISYSTSFSQECESEFSSSAHRWRCLPHLSSASLCWSVLTSRSSGFFSDSCRCFTPPLPLPAWLGAPALCSARMHHTTSQKCAGHSLSLTLWEHVMAQSWWIPWAVDLLITVLGWAVNTQIVTNNLQKSPPLAAFLLWSCKWVLRSAPQVTLRQ